MHLVGCAIRIYYDARTYERHTFEIASSCINTPLPAFLEVLEAVLKRNYCNTAAVLSWPSEWLECQRSDGLSMTLSVVGNRKVTNLENMAQQTDYTVI